MTYWCFSGEPVISERGFEHSIEEILTKAKKLFDKVIVLGPIRVDERKTCPALRIYLYYKNKWINVYGNYLKASVNTLRYVSTFEDVLTLDCLTVFTLHPRREKILFSR